MPRSTVKGRKPAWQTWEMSGHKPMSSYWLWISKLLFGLDWTNSRYKPTPVLPFLLRHYNDTLNYHASYQKGLNRLRWWILISVIFPYSQSPLAFRLEVISDILTAGTWTLPPGLQVNQVGTDLVCTWMSMEHGKRLSAIKPWTACACSRQVWPLESYKHKSMPRRLLLSVVIELLEVCHERRMFDSFEALEDIWLISSGLLHKASRYYLDDRESSV